MIIGPWGHTTALRAENNGTECRSTLWPFLTELALLREVDAGTQNQALSAILFYYHKVLGRDMQFINRLRARETTHLPLVLSMDEMEKRDATQFFDTMRG